MFANGAATAAFASIVAESASAGNRSNSFDPISPDIATPDVETAQIELNVDATLVESPYSVQGPPNRAVYSSSGIMEEVVVTAPNLSGRIRVSPARATATIMASQFIAHSRVNGGDLAMGVLVLASPVAAVACASNVPTCYKVYQLARAVYTGFVGGAKIEHALQRPLVPSEHIPINPTWVPYSATK